MQATTIDATELHHGDAWLYSCDPHFYGSDEFATTYQKVVVCPKRQPHSWVDCPFAHIGEKAKRRDLRFFSYTPELCQEAKRNLACPRGDACGKSHHVRICCCSMCLLMFLQASLSLSGVDVSVSWSCDELLHVKYGAGHGCLDYARGCSCVCRLCNTCKPTTAAVPVHAATAAQHHMPDSP
eukprot:GHRQ01035472.1.p1 GENE.GHRQ01035472.1~~GHRQ01035472.1.p1  ORF type:complete len:182 (+),score=33.52 GHRQ01035472.1:398-943(+)